MSLAELQVLGWWTRVFRRADPNEDGKSDMSDAIAILGCLFLGTICPCCPCCPCCPRCPDAADVNDDGREDISDALFLLNWLFLGGPVPPPPFGVSGVDTTEDALGECSYPDCE